MTQTSPDDAMAALLTRELHQMLTGEGLTEPVNLRITQQDSRVLIHIMAASTGKLGMLLAALSDPAELGDPDSRKAPRAVWSGTRRLEIWTRSSR